MDKKKLYKSVNDKKLAGVCGGVANYLGIDAALIRIAWFIITWFHGFGLVLYIAAALILSDDPNEVVARYDKPEKYNEPAKPEPENVVDIDPKEVEIVDEEEIKS